MKMVAGLQRVGEIPERATHVVRGFNAAGELLGETWHVGQGSVDCEIPNWRRDSRCVRVDVVDRETLTVRSIDL